MASHASQLPLGASPQTETIEIQEFDQSNNLIATYLKTSQQVSDKGYREKSDVFRSFLSDKKSERIDVQVEKKKRSAYGYGRSILAAFLPVGYPESVSEDYLEYQIYDSLQAFSSSIAGMLSSRAVLEGIGVGSTHTTPTNALLLSILQESLGRVATILFASRLGPALEAECKFYRLAADVFNDCAMLLDCLSPALPTMQRVILLSCSSVLRSLCGIAAGSSKASLSLHFAKNGNVADLAAKDSSQETVISLLGMLVGSVVITHINTKATTWITLIILLSVHLYTNYRAVRAVRLNTLNQQRANIFFSHFVSGMEVSDEPTILKAARKSMPAPSLPSRTEALGPAEVSRLERIFTFRDGQLLWTDRSVLCACRLGVSISSILAVLPNITYHSNSGSYKTPTSSFSLLLDIFKNHDYILYFDRNTNTILLALKEHNQLTYLQAWFHAFLLLRYLEVETLREHVDETFEKRWEGGDLEEETEPDKILWRALLVTVTYVGLQWGDVQSYLDMAGWDVGAENMVTVGGKTRFGIRMGDEKEMVGKEGSDEESERSEEGREGR